MRIETYLKRCLPRGIKVYIRKQINKHFSNFKRPKMVWGYLDSSGIWRKRTRISDTVHFYHPERISIGDNVFIWHYSILDGVGGLTIDEGCQIGAWVGIFTHSSHIAIRLYGNHYQEIPEAERKGYSIAPVKIGKYTFVGPNSIIMPGVTVGKGVIVSAGSMVTGNVPDYAIVSGNPAKVVGDTRNIDKPYLRDRMAKEYYEEWQQDFDSLTS